MSKNKRSKKRERIPVIDTLIDLAGAMTLDYLAAKRRQKNGTKRSKKIDPYAATGAAMGMGLIKDTDDIIKFGGVLGAMGAFDSDDDLPISTAAYMAPRDNRYPFLCFSAASVCGAAVLSARISACRGWIHGQQAFSGWCRRWQSRHPPHTNGHTGCSQKSEWGGSCPQCWSVGLHRKQNQPRQFCT